MFIQGSCSQDDVSDMTTVVMDIAEVLSKRAGKLFHWEMKSTYDI